MAESKEELEKQVQDIILTLGISNQLGQVNARSHPDLGADDNGNIAATGEGREDNLGLQAAKEELQWWIQELHKWIGHNTQFILQVHI